MKSITEGPRKNSTFWDVTSKTQAGIQIEHIRLEIKICPVGTARVVLIAG
jgi:hypothetical protein